eukprot:scaffold1387_cov382-Prasinococcus_capsulatus_cf.AAC.2
MTVSIEETVAERYKHFLQPIKDLATNWNVDIASELEEYLADLSEIQFSFDEGQSSLNFAEGAPQPTPTLA